MNPRFEEHDSILFRMLEEPVPLTPEATFPCLVRLIQDDSRLGILNKLLHEGCYHEILYLCTSCNYQVCHILINGKEYDDFYPKYEIIGYPVADGSRWWALYQMMQGEKVSYKGAIGNVYWALNQDGNAQQYTMDNFAYIGAIRSKLEFGKNHAVNTGWQIYKEPETDKEPIADCDNCKHRCTKSNIDYCQMYEPKPTFKVGDWVKYDIDSYLQVIEPSDKERTLCKTLSGAGAIVYPYTSLLTKVSPSEVVVHIGCLSGTVSFADADRFILRGIGNSEMANACIMFKMLDAATCVLVESLLKAQDEDK